MRKTWKKIVSVLMALTFVVLGLPVFDTPVKSAKAADAGVSYIDETGTKQTYTGTYISISGSHKPTNWSGGWYVVEPYSDAYTDILTISNRVALSNNATVNIILKDGARLRTQSGITVPSGCTLNIYAQSTGSEMGQLFTGSSNVKQNNAGIGSTNNSSAGTITINGGKITAYGGSNGAGIGGGRSGAGGTITINGGEVEAHGGSNGGAGIGGGVNGSASGTQVITINGGKVTAEGRAEGCGIGSGSGQRTCGTITINDGTVNAETDEYVFSDCPSAIGGYFKNGDSITINGGTVNATSYHSATAIGSNQERNGARIEITGGKITATAEGHNGTGIGNGYDSTAESATSVSISITDDDSFINATRFYGKVELKTPVKVKGSSTEYPAGVLSSNSSINGKTLVKGTTYTITWKDGDGNVLSEDKYAPGATPAYTGETTPTKTQTDKFTYTFNNTWAPAIVAVDGDATYTAQFDETIREYTIKFVNYDGTELQSSDVAYGETPAYGGETPTKPATDKDTFTFSGWDPEITSVTGTATYTAQYTSTVNEYTIKFVNYDGTELQSSDVAYGETPVYDGETPTKPATTQYTYTFSGWDPEIKPVDGTATYTAQYSTTVNEYTIKFVNYDGTELQSSDVAYGETPAYGGETPTKPATAQYTYTFFGWDPEITSVTGDATYTAQYTSTVNKYTITWKNYNGTVLEEDKEVPYGATPTYDKVTPTRQATTQYTYTFLGWYPEITPVTGDAVYTVQFDSTVNEYTIKFVNYDGTELQSGDVAYGQTPAYTGETPTKAADAQYTYTFSGWDPEITYVEGTATYTATYTSAPRKYTIKFVNEDGTELQSSEVAYGETPEYTGDTPTKEADAQYTYSFGGWSLEIAPVEGDATYTATYTSTVNEYTITFVNEDGTELQSGKVAYGETPKYDGATPTKASDDKYDYTFDSWTPAIAEVTGDATYTATYKATEIKKDEPVVMGVYKYVSEGAPKYTKGSKKSVLMIFKRTENDEITFEKFQGLKTAKGELISGTHYTAKKGSVEITLLPEYLETLEVGKTAITVSFEDGDPVTIELEVVAAQQQTDPQNPATGDQMNYIWIFFGIGVAALAILIFVQVQRRREEEY